MARTRVWLLAVAVLGLSVASLYVVADSLSTGTSSLPIRRMGNPLSFSRTEAPIGFFVCIALYALLGSVGLWFFGRLGLALLTPKNPTSTLAVDEQVRYLDSLAPSGLRPLWIALLMVTALALAWFLLGCASI